VPFIDTQSFAYSLVEPIRKSPVGTDTNSIPSNIRNSTALGSSDVETPVTSTRPDTAFSAAGDESSVVRPRHSYCRRPSAPLSCVERRDCPDSPPVALRSLGGTR